MREPLITAMERNSAVWQKLKPYLETRLETLRRQNDGQLTPDQTAKVRGRIAEVKGLLSLGTDKPQVADESAQFKD